MFYFCLFVESDSRSANVWSHLEATRNKWVWRLNSKISHWSPTLAFAASSAFQVAFRKRQVSNNISWEKPTDYKYRLINTSLEENQSDIILKKNTQYETCCKKTIFWDGLWPGDETIPRMNWFHGWAHSCNLLFQLEQVCCYQNTLWSEWNIKVKWNKKSTELEFGKRWTTLITGKV